MQKRENKNTNQLIHETSPYLLQHAHNPVNWYPWNETTLALAKRENKPLLVSIGYSACHWCHVMEHESFEDEEVAMIMNENFICIKVDREERPDVDQVYMDAVQMISGRGGWPLNCFALPDGRPFWGATYFPKGQWLAILDQVAILFKNEPDKLEQQAAEIGKGMKGNQIFTPHTDELVLKDRGLADKMISRIMSGTDSLHGGFKGAPKFPMPGNFLFLLNGYNLTRNRDILSRIDLTLTKMANGGIYDQIGGGFARYSVDERWHIPHFEKMLYDNAQLVSLYAEAFKITRNERYAEVVRETLAFIKRELTHEEGGFYSALDADSEGVEGKYYVWTKEEIQRIAGDKTALISEYFGIDKEALWENGNNVLVRKKTMGELAEKSNMEPAEASSVIREVKSELLAEREKRVRPGLDDKILTSWNAMMLKGYIDAYHALNQSEYFDSALKTGDFIIHHMMAKDGSLFRNYKNGKLTIPGFLDDYSFTIEAFIALYEATFDEKWLLTANLLAAYCIEHFFDQQSNMFFYVSDIHKDVITKTIEVVDNVIPSSNSVLAISLYKLSLLFEKPEYMRISERMLLNVADKMTQYPSGFSNWGILFMHFAYPFHTLVITGKEAKLLGKEVRQQFHPDILIAASVSGSDLPVFQNRYLKEQTQLFVCTGSECMLPVGKLEEAMRLIPGKENHV